MRLYNLKLVNRNLKSRNINGHENLLCSLSDLPKCLTYPDAFSTNHI